MDDNTPCIVTCYKERNGTMIEADRWEEELQVMALGIAEGLTGLSIYDKIEVETVEGITLVTYTKDPRTGLYQKGF